MKFINALILSLLMISCNPYSAEHKIIGKWKLLEFEIFLSYTTTKDTNFIKFAYQDGLLKTQTQNQTKITSFLAKYHFYSDGRIFVQNDFDGVSYSYLGNWQINKKFLFTEVPLFKDFLEIKKFRIIKITNKTLVGQINDFFQQSTATDTIVKNLTGFLVFESCN